MASSALLAGSLAGTLTAKPTIPKIPTLTTVTPNIPQPARPAIPVISANGTGMGNTSVTGNMLQPASGTAQLQPTVSGTTIQPSSTASVTKLQPAVTPTTMTAPVTSPAVIKPAVPTVTSNPGTTTTATGAIVNPATGGYVGQTNPPPANNPVPPTQPVPPAPAVPNLNGGGVGSDATPPATDVPDQFSSNVTAAEKAYQDNLQMSPEEIQAQEELDRLQQSYRTGYQNTADQTIPLDFITGQQKSLENRSLALAEPLEAKLSRLQAKRTAALDASKFALTAAQQKLKDNQELQKPITVSAGESAIRYNPTTKKYETVFTGPAKNQTLSDKYGTGPLAEYSLYSDQEAAAGREPLIYNDWKTQDDNRKAKAAQITSGGLNSQQQNAAFKLSDDYEKASGDFSKIVSNYNRVVASAQNPSPAGDLALVFSYMKTLDPTSVVREGEQASASNAGSIGDKIINQYNSLLNGERLTPTQRTDFVNRSRALYDSAVNQQKQVDATYSSRAQQYGIPASYVIRDQGSYSGTPTPAAPNQAPTSTAATYAPKVQAALAAGYQPTEVIAKLRTDPALSSAISAAEKSGYTPNEILNYLSTFKSPLSSGQKGSLAVAPANRNPSKVILGFDFTNYATDPNWGNGVQKIISTFPPVNSPAAVAQVISTSSPKSPLLAHTTEIYNIAQNNGIDPRLLLAIMKQESNFGTLGRAAFTHNPANVGNVDSGANKDWGDWLNGVNALAKNISKRTIA